MNKDCIRLAAVTFLIVGFAAELGAQDAATGKNTKTPSHYVPPVWSALYNAAQGPLPDTSTWKVVLQDRNLAVRLAPNTEWNRYASLTAGQVRFTGTEIYLKPRQIDEIADLLQSQLEKDMPRVKLSPAPGAKRTLRVDANITSAMVNPLVNVPSVAVSLAPARRGRASLTAWLYDSETNLPVASVELASGDQGDEWYFGVTHTGRLRAALRTESHTLARALAQVGRSAAAANHNSPAH